MTTPRNIAVFIDFENFGQDDSFDAHAVIERLKEKGRLLIKRAYADWGRFAKYKRMMLENSIELTEMPSHGGRGKNSADIQLVVDALEIALTRDYIDTFVVVSGDSDFTPLISKLRMQGKYVIVVGEQRQLSGLIKGYCDELIYYRTLIGGPQKVEAGSGELEAAFELLQRAVILLEKDGSEPRGSQVKTIMRQLDPSFDEANHGFSQFRRFLKTARDKGLIRMAEMDSGGDVLVASSGSGSNSAPGGSPSRREGRDRRRSEPRPGDEPRGGDSLLSREEPGQRDEPRRAEARREEPRRERVRREVVTRPPLAAAPPEQEEPSAADSVGQPGPAAAQPAESAAAFPDDGAAAAKKAPRKRASRARSPRKQAAADDQAD